MLYNKYGFKGNNLSFEEFLEICYYLSRTGHAAETNLSKREQENCEWQIETFVHSENKRPKVSTKVHLKHTTAEQAGGHVMARASSGSGLLKFTDQVTIE